MSALQLHKIEAATSARAPNENFANVASHLAVDDSERELRAPRECQMNDGSCRTHSSVLLSWMFM
jgi:hypothetical protein